MQPNGLHGLAALLVFQALGELLVRLFGLALPGPVLGMLLLLPALRWRWLQQSVGCCAEFLLQHLSLLFVPVGVGMVVHLPLLQSYGWRIALVLLVSTVLGLAVTAWVLRACLRRQEG